MKKKLPTQRATPASKKLLATSKKSSSKFTGTHTESKFKRGKVETLKGLQKAENKAGESGGLRQRKSAAKKSGPPFENDFKGKPVSAAKNASFSERGKSVSKSDKPTRVKKNDLEGNNEVKNFTRSKTKPFHKKSFKKPKSDALTSRPKSVHDGIRLNRYIANSGICSRREADTLIQQGLIEVNGETVTEMGVIVKNGDVVRYDGRVLKPERNVYVLLNKPKDFITTTHDPEERKTVMALVANAAKERIYPVGRLDRQTTGLLLFTNDGELADKLTHPSQNVKKIYEAQIDRPLLPEDAEAILNGVYLDEGKATVDSMAILDETRKRLGLEIHIGWNRVVRRMFEAKGYKVVKLDRVVYAGLTKKDLPRGTWRYLTEEEVRGLKYFNTAAH